MKIELEKAGDVLLELISKYGIWVAIIVLIWLGLKKMWFWVFMPLAFLILLQQLACLNEWEAIAKVNPIWLIISWIFVFSFLKGFASLWFDENKDEKVKN